MEKEVCVVLPSVTKTRRKVKVETEGRKRKAKLFCQRMWKLASDPLPQERSSTKKFMNADFSKASQQQWLAPNQNIARLCLYICTARTNVREGQSKSKHTRPGGLSSALTCLCVWGVCSGDLCSRSAAGDFIVCTGLLIPFPGGLFLWRLTAAKERKKTRHSTRESGLPKRLSHPWGKPETETWPCTEPHGENSQHTVKLIILLEILLCFHLNCRSCKYTQW